MRSLLSGATRAFLPCYLLTACPGDKGADTSDCSQYCETPAYRTEDVQSASKEQACVTINGDACEVVIKVELCLDATCFQAEDVTGDAFHSFFGGSTARGYDDGQYCVDNDKEHLYRFTILYCAAPPSNVFGPA